MKDFKIKLHGKKLLCENTYLFTFHRPESGYEFFPGQYAYFTLPENLIFSDTDKKGISRPFSFAGSPDKEKLIIAVRENGSVFVRNILSLEQGSELYLSKPFGINISADRSDKVLVAGGIGITPVRSLMEYYSANLPDENITLLYFNRKRRQTAFLNEFEKWSENIPGFDFIPFIEDKTDEFWKYEFGVFTGEILMTHVENFKNKKYYLFGSDLMDENVKRILTENGVKEENIITEKTN
ncbi:MAG: FAD-dependent oxidoreductase [Bacteroidetes bacterium]|nr:FAD-dependent oxidoreductase [Bacteroidota bacterium]